jgi:signal transduction histidine kinase
MNVQHSHASTVGRSTPGSMHPAIPVQRTSDDEGALESALLLASQYRVMASLYATVSHDFRNALNAMSLSAELLHRTAESGQPDTALQRRYIDSIRQELRGMTRSLANVLDENHFDRSYSARCRLPDILESAASLIRPRADKQRVGVSLDVPGAATEVAGRAGELRLAVLNLAANALDAMPHGGQLTLRLTTGGGFAAISVSDTGPGIPEDLRPLVWDLSFSSRGPGPGLGLHVVTRVAQAHGGAVTLDSSNAGASFTIRLPLRT